MRPKASSFQSIIYSPNRRAVRSSGAAAYTPFCGGRSGGGRAFPYFHVLAHAHTRRCAAATGGAPPTRVQALGTRTELGTECVRALVLEEQRAALQSQPSR